MNDGPSSAPGMTASTRSGAPRWRRHGGVGGHGAQTTARGTRQRAAQLGDLAAAGTARAPPRAPGHGDG